MMDDPDADPLDKSIHALNDARQSEKYLNAEFWNTLNTLDIPNLELQLHEVWRFLLLKIDNVDIVNSCIKLWKGIPQMFNKSHTSNVTNSTGNSWKVSPKVEYLVNYLQKLDMFDFTESQLAKLVCLLEIIESTTQVEEPKEVIYLAPPTNECHVCGNSIQVYHKPIDVTVYTLHGVKRGKQQVGRCSRCKVQFNFSTYHDMKEDCVKYYNSTVKQQQYVEASTVSYVEMKLVDQFAYQR